MDKLESEKRTKLLFFGSLALVALMINSLFLMTSRRRPGPVIAQQQAQQSIEMANAAAADKAAMEKKAAFAKHAKFLERHLNLAFTHKPGIKSAALAVSCDGKPDHALDAALAERFRGDAVQILPAFFTPEFVSDGLFDGVFVGSKEACAKLDLAKYVDSVILARESAEYSVNPSLDNVLTATIRLEVTSFSIPANGLVQTWTFVANGAGFKQAEARAMAEERLAKQIAGDTKMSLPP